MKRKRIFVILIVLLILSNAFTVFLLFKGKHHGHPPFISEKIGLIGDKLEKARKMEELHFEKMKPLTEKIQKQQAELFTSISESNSTKQDSILSNLNQLNAERESILLNHFKSLYAYCDSNEKEKLVNEIKNHFSKLHPPKR